MSTFGNSSTLEGAQRPAGLPPLPQPYGRLLLGSGERAGHIRIDGAERARQATAVGNAIARLHRENYGRGATRTRTIYQRNHVVAFLEDIYTPVERTLIDAGSQEDVKRTRQSFQMAMRDRFSTAVEEITGRKVVQFMSQVSFEPDMAAEIFVLEPDGNNDIVAEAETG